MKSYQPKDYLREALKWYGVEGTWENGFLSMSEIGALYGKTSHEVGRILKRLGYRDRDGHPTRKAFEGHFVAPRGSLKFT